MQQKKEKMLLKARKILESEGQKSFVVFTELTGESIYKT